jgi:hypothetical protein
MYGPGSILTKLAPRQLQESDFAVDIGSTLALGMWHLVLAVEINLVVI